MKRNDVREKMMKKLYQMDLNGDFSSETVCDFCRNSVKGARNQKYAEDIMIFIIENCEEIDGQINRNAHKWNTARMPKTDLAISRIAVAEMMHTDDIPSAVSINEAVKISKKYGTDNSGKFINGMLASVLKGLA